MVTYGEKCNKDSDCLSNICQYTGKFNERKCIIQQPKYGKQCNYNKDCKSNKCIGVNDANGNYVGKKCVVINNLEIPEKYDIDLTPDPKYVPYANDPNYQDEMKGVLLTDTQKKLAFKGKGPITEYIVLAMEFVLFLWKDVFLEFLKSIFRFFLVIWSIFPFGLFKMDAWLGFSNKYKDSNGKCKKNSLTLTKKFQTILIAVLFPPLGVFFDRGIKGAPHIFITFVLTTMMYIPGLTYAIELINETVCPNSIVIYEQEEYKGPRHVLMYGDYSMKNSTKLQSMRKCAKRGWSGVENYANIQSIKVGKNVKVELYADENFSDKITTVEGDEKKFIDKIYGAGKEYVHENCTLRLGEKKNVPKIGALSIILKEPKKIEPETLNPNSVYFYLLNNFRGKYLELKEGDYNYDELTKIFNKRISSIRIGSNMMVKLFEDKNYNRKLFVNFKFAGKGGTKYFNTNGGEKIYMGTQKYDGSENPGEIKIIKDGGLYDNVSSIMIRPIHETKSPESVFDEAEPEGNLKTFGRALKEDVYESALRDTVYTGGLRGTGVGAKGFVQGTSVGAKGFVQGTSVGAKGFVQGTSVGAKAVYNKSKKYGYDKPKEYVYDKPKDYINKKAEKAAEKATDKANEGIKKANEAIEKEIAAAEAAAAAKEAELKAEIEKTYESIKAAKEAKEKAEKAKAEAEAAKKQQQLQ